MPRHVALLRGVSSMNAKMPALRESFERAGFANVVTVLGSGNAVFDAPAHADGQLARRAEAAMQAAPGRSFRTFVRPLAHLQALFDADPFSAFALPAEAKRVVTFLDAPLAQAPMLPVEKAEARILAIHGREIFTAYLPPAGTSRVLGTDRRDLRRRQHHTHRGHAAQVRRRMNARPMPGASFPPRIPTIHA